MKKLYVGNLPFRATDQEIQELFGQWMIITRSNINAHFVQHNAGQRQSAANFQHASAFKLKQAYRGRQYPR